MAETPTGASVRKAGTDEAVRVKNEQNEHKMKPIKITIQNKVAIETALLAANGKAMVHTFTRATELQSAACAAEVSLAKLGLPVSARKGASVLVASGQKLPSAYKYKVKITHATLVRGTTGWTLTELASVAAWNGGGSMLTLTAAQDERIVAGVRAGYRISKR